MYETFLVDEGVLLFLDGLALPFMGRGALNCENDVSGATVPGENPEAPEIELAWNDETDDWQGKLCVLDEGRTSFGSPMPASNAGSTTSVCCVSPVSGGWYSELFESALYAKH